MKETIVTLSLEDTLKEVLLKNDNGHFELYGAHVCFFRIKNSGRIQIIFPFRIFEFDYKKIAENPLEIAMKLVGHIEEMKNYGMNLCGK